MAILNKRSSSATLPGATPQQTAGRPSDKMKAVQKTASRPSAVLTGALKPNSTATTTGSSTATPGINAGTPNSLTTKVSGTTRPSITRTAAPSNSNAANTLKNALIGAGVGMAGKAAYDKIFSGSKPTTGGTGSSVVDRVVNTAKDKVVNPLVDKAVNAVTGALKGKPTAPPAKPTTGGLPTRPPVANKPTSPTRPATGSKPPAKPPVSSKTPTAGGAGKGTEGSDTPNVDVSETGTDAYGGKVNEDGSITYTYDDGSTITMDVDGNVISSTDSVDDSVVDEVDTGGSDYDDFGGLINDDGSVTYTYDDGSTITLDSDGNVVSSTDAEYEGSGETELGYYEDEDGNIYDSNGDLVYSAGGDYTDEYVDEEDNSDYVYTDEYGYQYDYDGNLIYDPYDTGYGYDDSPVEIPEDWYTDEEYEYSEPEYFEDLDDWWGKKGGLVALMANGGGVRHFYDGGYSDTEEEVQDWQNVGYKYPEYGGPALSRPFDLGEEVQDWQNVGYNFGEFDNPTMTGYTLTGNRNPIGNTYNTADSEVIDTEIFDDGSYIEYMSDGSYVTYDSDGNLYQSSAGGGSEEQLGSEWPAGYISNGDGTATMVMDDGSTITVDENMNPVYTTDRTDTVITGAGGTGGSTYRKPVNPAQTAQQRLQQQREQGALSSLSNWFKDNPTLGAGAAGALVGTLLSNDNLFGGSNEPAPSIDMSKAGVINPRTTDFGIGAPRFVTYNEYSARDQMPELYGDELYRNLNAPGFNPVREGDYGYEEEQAPAQAAQPQMADGGSVDTYFTFGKPIDPLQNLKNPQPTQQGQQAGGLGGMMPQMPKPQMPVQAGQQMPQQMKRGGLPAISDVPLAEGRLDFRKGSAVHGPGDGQSDDIPAMLADGEYVIDAETVAQIGNGSTKAGAQALDKFRENIRAHKRSAPVNKIPPKTKALTSYLKKGK